MVPVPAPRSSAAAGGSISGSLNPGLLRSNSNSNSNINPNPNANANNPGPKSNLDIGDGNPNSKIESRGGDDGDSSTAYQTALDKLQPLQPVLRGFNHRNRNQHRRAAWWAPFGMLRRHVDRLVDELLESSAAASSASSAFRSKGKKRKREGNAAGDGPAQRKVRDHVLWVRDVLAPKCYLAFSQLTADNRFAALGVVLLGALAQVHSVCVSVVGDTPVAAAAAGSEQVIQGIGEGSSASGKNPRLPSRPAGAAASGALGRGGGEGSVVSRDAAARAEKQRQRKEDGRSKLAVGADTDGGRRGVDDDAATAEKKEQQERQSAMTSKTKIKVDEGAKKPSKKKKPKKGGDEFDALFNNLF